jgi:hypothetical protein
MDRMMQTVKVRMAPSHFPATDILGLSQPQSDDGSSETFKKQKRRPCWYFAKSFANDRELPVQASS